MKNAYRSQGGCTYIVLRRRGGEAIETVIDTADLPAVSSHQGTWCAHQSRRSDCPYARRTSVRMKIRSPEGRVASIRLHSVLLPVPDGEFPDHIDNNGLNNRRSNLRPATNAQNCQNKPKTVSNSSGYKGVYRYRAGWATSICSGGKNKWLGCFPTPQEAAQQYDDAARSIFGPFARLNFPMPGEAEA